MKRRAIAALVLGAVALALSSVLSVAAVGAKSTDPARQYVVLYEKGVSTKSARAAIKKAGGRVIRENLTIGLATVVSKNGNFVRAATATKALRSAGRNRPFGRSFAARQRHLDLAQLDRALGSAGSPAATPRSSGDDHDDDHGRHRGRGHKKGEPFASLQWDMQMVHATRKGSYHEQKGRKKVLVGVIDSGIDASHPDIARNFNRELSRNFAPDIPGLDDGCGVIPAPCLDPADVDGDARDGHGTHVAGTIGAAINGLGTSGVAPKVTLVNLRAGQDSGFFFLPATLEAMTYAADNGIDVVNMSYFTDPWLFNCRANPSDSPAEQAEQRLIIDATQRAADYARSHGVTLVAALGNEAIDLGKPTFDPLDDTRAIDNTTCVNVPTETDGVISVSSLGPSRTKSDFSNYGVEQTDLSAPGGYFQDNFGTDRFQVAQNLILSTYPQSVALANNQLNPDGTPNNPSVLRDCKDGVCGYYQYLQGTSMASPHVAGVAALIVSEHGSKRRGKGITMDPIEVERILKETAADTACPNPPLLDYTPSGLPASRNALCEGTPEFNGFYGHGIVDALAAVRFDDENDHDEDDDEH